jgi:hypothetical protein
VLFTESNGVGPWSDEARALAEWREASFIVVHPGAAGRYTAPSTCRLSPTERASLQVNPCFELANHSGTRVASLRLQARLSGTPLPARVVLDPLRFHDDGYLEELHRQGVLVRLPSRFSDHAATLSG